MGELTLQRKCSAANPNREDCIGPDRQHALQRTGGQHLTTEGFVRTAVERAVRNSRHASREAAKECSPRRKPWVTCKN